MGRMGTRGISQTDTEAWHGGSFTWPVSWLQLEDAIPWQVGSVNRSSTLWSITASHLSSNFPALYIHMPLHSPASSTTLTILFRWHRSFPFLVQIESISYSFLWLKERFWLVKISWLVQIPAALHRWTWLKIIIIATTEEAHPYERMSTKHNHIVSQTDTVKLQTSFSRRNIVLRCLASCQLVQSPGSCQCGNLHLAQRRPETSSPFEALHDAAQWNTQRKTKQRDNTLNYCTQNPPHLPKLKWYRLMPWKTKTSWCTLISIK